MQVTGGVTGAAVPTLCGSLDDQHLIYTPITNFPARLSIVTDNSATTTSNRSWRIKVNHQQESIIDIWSRCYNMNATVPTWLLKDVFSTSLVSPVMWAPSTGRPQTMPMMRAILIRSLVSTTIFVWDERADTAEWSGRLSHLTQVLHPWYVEVKIQSCCQVLVSFQCQRICCQQLLPLETLRTLTPRVSMTMSPYLKDMSHL